MHAHTHAHAHTHMHTHMYACIHTHMHARTRMHTHTRTHMYTHVHTHKRLRYINLTNYQLFTLCNPLAQNYSMYDKQKHLECKKKHTGQAKCSVTKITFMRVWPMFSCYVEHYHARQKVASFCYLSVSNYLKEISKHKLKR